MCPTCLVCLLQFMLRQCRLGHPASFQWLQHPREVLLQPGLTSFRSDTAFRDQHLANYEVRLIQEGSVSPAPNAMAGASVPCSAGHSWVAPGASVPCSAGHTWVAPGASVPCSAGHSWVAQPGAEGTCNPLLTGEPASPWARHQEHAHKLSAYAKHPL